MLCARYLLNNTKENTGEVATTDTWTVEPSYEEGGVTPSAMADGAMSWDEETTAKVLNNLAFTWAGWIYVNAESGSNWKRNLIFGNSSFGANDNRKFSIYQYPTCNDLYLSWMNDLSANTFVKHTEEGLLPSYTWTHIAITYSSSTKQVTIYKNGEIISTLDGCESSSSTFKYATQIFWSNQYRRLNDVRIYNECLSETDIKRLGMGLMLHWKCVDYNKSLSKDLIEIDSSQYNDIGKSGGTTPFMGRNYKDGSYLPIRYSNYYFFKNVDKCSISSTNKHRLTNFSISFWVMCTYSIVDNRGLEYDKNSDYEKRLVMSEGLKDGTYCWGIETTYVNKLVFNYGDFNTTINVSNEKWYNVIITVDVNGNISLYVNKELKGSGKSSTTVEHAEGSAGLVIGGKTGSSLSPSNECISDVRMYARCLTKDEVVRLYGISTYDYY